MNRGLDVEHLSGVSIVLVRVRFLAAVSEWGRYPSVRASLAELRVIDTATRNVQNVVRDIFWGLLSVFPLLCGAVGITFMTPPGDGAESPGLGPYLFAVSGLATFVVPFLFLLHAAFSGRVPDEKKCLWFALLFLGNIWVTPFYYWHYIRTPGEAKDNQPAPLNGS